MSSTRTAASARTSKAPKINAGTTTAMRVPVAPEAKDPLDYYECGPIRFTGSNDALYERHLMFDNVVSPAATGPRERYEAVARSVRDILSQRWLRTEQTYARENPKRVYYLSMEYLIGRSLANNIMNLRQIRECPSRLRALPGRRGTDAMAPDDCRWGFPTLRSSGIDIGQFQWTGSGRD